MKQINQDTMKKWAVMALATQLMSIAPSALAQDEQMFLDEGSDVYNSEQIDIDGEFARKESAADRIAKMRKKLEKDNEAMVQKKIEDIRIEQEQELAKKLNNAFNGQGSVTSSANSYDSNERYDEATVLNAAPQRVETVLEDEEESLRNKVTPTIGVRNFDGSRIDSFQSKTSFGLLFENMVTNRLSIGLGANYTTMDISYVDYGSLYNYYGTIGYNSSNADEISYRNLNLNANAKLFLAVDSKIKPFIGAQVGYNRTRLRFDERSSEFGFQYANQQEDTSVTGTNVTGTGIVGAEVELAKNIALTADFRFTRAMTKGFDSLGAALTGNGQIDSDKKVLGDIGSRLEDSDIASLNFGFVVKF